MKIATKAAFLSGAAIIPIFLLFSDEIARLLIINDEILLETVFAIRSIGFSMPFISLIYLFSTYYQISWHIKIAIALSFFKDFGFYLLSMVSCVLFMIFLRVRYGKRFPLLLEAADIVSRDAKLNFDRVLELNDWAEGKILKRGIDSKLAMRISLIIEEIVMSFDDAKLQSAYIYADKIKKITG